MRKSIIALFTLALLPLASLRAQTMYIWNHNLAVTYPAAEVGDITYINGGSDLLVCGDTISTSYIDSITMGADLDKATVTVTYTGLSPIITLPYTLVHTLTVELPESGEDVEITSTNSEGDGITYVLSGTSTNGSFTLNGKYKCDVKLQQLSLASTSGPAINILTGKRTRFNLGNAGDVNTLSDAAGGSHKACLYVKGHPEFEGDGTLNITAATGHGLASTEYLEIASGNINILAAPSDGIHGKHYFKMTGGNVNIQNIDGDGIQAEITDDTSDEDNGQLIISGGTLSITGKAADASALKSDSLMTLQGGNITIDMDGAGVKGLNSGTDIVIGQSGTSATTSAIVLGITVNGGEYTDPTTGDTKKTRGIKADRDLTVMSGTTTVTATGKKSKSIKVDGTSTLYSQAKVTTNDGYSFDAKK